MRAVHLLPRCVLALPVLLAQPASTAPAVSCLLPRATPLAAARCCRPPPTRALCSRAEVFDALRTPEPPGGGAVSVGNPQTADFEVVRPSLLPSALKTLAANKSEPLPLRLFELSDVVLLDGSRDVGARNERRLVAVHCGKAAEFEVLHGLLNRLMEVLGVPHAGEGLSQGRRVRAEPGGARAGARAGARGTLLRRCGSPGDLGWRGSCLASRAVMCV